MFGCFSVITGAFTCVFRKFAAFSEMAIRRLTLLTFLLHINHFCLLEAQARCYVFIEGSSVFFK